MRAELARQCEPVGVARPAGHDDIGGARLLCGDDAGEALPSGPEDDDGVADADAAFELRPANPIGQRHVERRALRRHRVGEPVDQRMRVEIHILAVATPEPRRHLDRGEAVHLLHLHPAAHVIATGQTIFAAPARRVFLHDDAVAFLDVPASRRIRADLGDASDDLVSGNERRRRKLGEVAGVDRPVGAAHAGDLDLRQAELAVDLREWEFAQLDLARRDQQGCQRFRGHAALFIALPDIRLTRRVRAGALALQRR